MGKYPYKGVQFYIHISVKINLNEQIIIKSIHEVRDGPQVPVGSDIITDVCPSSFQV